MTFRDCWILHGEGRKPAEVQVEDKPVAVSLAGPDRNYMSDKRFFFPVFAERNRKDTALISLFPGCVRSYHPEKVFDKTLDLLLSLSGGKL